MAVSSRRDTMYRNLMKQDKSKSKEEPRPKYPEDVKKLLEMWKKQKENKK